MTERSASLYALIALSAIQTFAAVPATGAAPSGYQPFASIAKTFWQPSSDVAKSYSSPDLAVSVEAETIWLATDCDGAALDFVGTPAELQLANVRRSSEAPSLGCAQNRANFELLIQNIKTASSFVLSGDKLVVSTRNNAPLELIRLRPKTFEYRYLRVAKYLGDGVAITPLENHLAEIVFFHGWIAGTPGCGGLYGSYKQAGPNEWHIVANWLLAGYCDDMDKVERQNNFVVKDLSSSISIETSPDGLFYFRDGNHRLRLMLIDE